MLAVCIEASHQRGLGHLYRALNLAAYLEERRVPHVVLVNEYAPALGVLRAGGVPHEAVRLTNDPGWEQRLIRRFGIKTWIDDRLDTDALHAASVRREGVRLATFDDHGEGAAQADLHVAALCFEGADRLRGSTVVTGLRYLILNRDIARLRRIRTAKRRILVTLGGTDTHGVTVKIVSLLKKAGIGASVVLGPGFAHFSELEAAATAAFEIKQGVPSLVEEFAAHDVAITGGGMTAFEACASGLPCVIVANEWFEVPAAKHLQHLGCAVFAGHHSEIGSRPLPVIEDVEAMSRAGLAGIGTDGVENVYREITAA